MKYIMFEISNGTLRRKIPIVFPSTLVHADVAAALKPMLDKYGTDIHVVNAGEATMICESVYGSSESLDIKSNQEDENVITFNDYCHGM